MIRPVSGDCQPTLQEYELGKLLGQGAFGAVYQCTKIGAMHQHGTARGWLESQTPQREPRLAHVKMRI
eukprot:307751-Amphidinium_carterae.1